MLKHAGLPEELPGIGIDVLPHLGDESGLSQRDSLVKYYSGDVAIDPSLFTDDPISDMARIRHEALSGYIESVMHRMRQGEIEEIKTAGKISSTDIFDILRTKDGENRAYLLTRKIAKARLQVAMETGTDRDINSVLNSHGDGYEQQALHEYGLSEDAAEEITYATPITQYTSEIAIAENQAVLVYASEALTPITPMHWDNLAKPYGIYAFVDTRLRLPSLLAIIEQS
jgi:hypothetical protein